MSLWVCVGTLATQTRQGGLHYKAYLLCLSTLSLTGILHTKPNLTCVLRSHAMHCIDGENLAKRKGLGFQHNAAGQRQKEHQLI